MNYPELIFKPGSHKSLDEFSTSSTGKYKSRKSAEKSLAIGITELSELQDKLYAHDRYSLLIIFQAMDAAGKDGTIKHVMSGVNPQGCQVSSFKVPSSEELDHDFLWRCMKQLPERGLWKEYMIAYEEMLKHTSTVIAPWYVIPADKKWFMRTAVSNIITDKLKTLKLSYPKVSKEQKANLAKARNLLNVKDDD
jgi:polyphosphate kinase 2 (PPK2 family)